VKIEIQYRISKVAWTSRRRPGEGRDPALHGFERSEQWQYLASRRLGEADGLCPAPATPPPQADEEVARAGDGQGSVQPGRSLTGPMIPRRLPQPPPRLAARSVPAALKQRSRPCRDAARERVFPPFRRPNVAPSPRARSWGQGWGRLSYARSVQKASELKIAIDAHARCVSY
jgi:hypothetical protein